MKSVLVCGAGGFIGAHLVCRLKAQRACARGVENRLSLKRGHSLLSRLEATYAWTARQMAHQIQSG